MMEKFRYRIITNLQCNNRCGFCYQKYKPNRGEDNILGLDKLTETISKVYKHHGKLDRATIMGGESLLIPNIHEYVSVIKSAVNTVCMVTNGTLLTRDKLKSLRDSGLDEIAISIHSGANYDSMLDILRLSDEYIPNMRVNIPRCDESSGDKLRTLVDRCLCDGFGCVVCEDLMGRYGDPHYDVIGKWDGVEEISNNHNFVMYKHHGSGKNFGLFAHYSGYNDTDVIITPLGNFSSWDKYCNKIDNYELR